MPELSSKSAAQVIGISDETIRVYVDQEILPARKQGLRGIIRIETDALKSFASEYGFRYNDQLATELSE